MNSKSDFQQQCEQLHLDGERIELHYQRIKQALTKGMQPKFPILETCTLANGGILPATWASDRLGSGDPQGYVAFIPAAGASSRYYAVFTQLMQFLEAFDIEKVTEESRRLAAEGALSWPLPPAILKLIKTVSRGEQPSPEDFRKISSELSLPKGLLPCVEEGMTFAEIKVLEHRSLACFLAQIFVVGLPWEEHFREHLQKAGAANFHLMVQGLKQSTIRFTDVGEPYRDEEGQFSVVPAGHGTLVNFLPEIRQQFRGAHSIFIRNIDNVTGDGDAVQKATKVFLRQHAWLLHTVRQIRQFLDTGELRQAAECATSLPLPPAVAAHTAEAHGFVETIADVHERLLWDVQCRLFHFHPAMIGKAFKTEEPSALLRRLFRRPVNTLGQVPNLGADVGGTPVFALSEHGPTKICLEVPHATSADKRLFLEDPQKATHFNPVFAAAEIDFPGGQYDEVNLPFWILSEKLFRGKKVCYHETLLYEFLGNNILANTVFIEIPRILFNPHKSVLDVAGRHRDYWVGATRI